MRRFAVLFAAAVCCAAVGCIVAGPASAGPTRFVTAPNLFANGGANATLHYAPTGLTESAHAGQFTVSALDTATGLSTILQVFCTDIFHYLSLPTTYTVGLLSNTLASPTKVSNINALLANGNALATNGTASAALQLAIWEVENEADGTAYSLTDGDFSVTNTGEAVLNAAAADLAKLASGEWQANSHGVVRQLTSEGRQSLSYLEVPEPASIVLLGAGLFLLGGLRARARR